MKAATWIVVAMGILAAFGLAQAAPPPSSLSAISEYVNYQGRLVDPNGVPYSNNVNHTVQLRLYDAASQGTELWAEQYAIKTQDGYFSILLGTGGSQIDGKTNKLWRVMWKQGGNPLEDSFFLGLTVMNDAKGTPLSTPVEAVPRQQFLTAPFAYRSFQSVYASKSAEIFEAPQGIQTPTIISTTEVAVTKSLRVDSASTLYANNLSANGANDLSVNGAQGKTLSVISKGGQLNLGLKPGTPYTYNARIDCGVYEVPVTRVSGSNVYVEAYNNLGLLAQGGNLGMSFQTMTFNGQPPMVYKYVTVAVSGASSGSASTGISTSLYDHQIVAGWYLNTAPAYPLRWLYISNGTIYAGFNSTVSVTVGVYVLGIRSRVVTDQ